MPRERAESDTRPERKRQEMLGVTIYSMTEHSLVNNGGLCCYLCSVIRGI